MNSENMLKAAHDFTLVIFGASGHLARIKLFPALYFLALKKRFPAQYAIVGFARSSMDDASFRMYVAASIRESVEGVNERVLAELLSNMWYHTGQYDNEPDYTSLVRRLNTLEAKFANPIIRLTYFSVPPSSFGNVAKNLCRADIRGGGPPSLPTHSARVELRGASRQFRAIVEKPLGDAYRSAQAIKQELTGCFQPSEIYLLDHYLGKEAARNIYYLRLINPIVERILKHTLVTNVQITASESAGIEGRAGYFEAVGVLRDMVQSHMLELMALLTMQLVPRDKLPQARLDALKNIYVPPFTDFSEIILQGQYARSNTHCGYREEENVVADSRTPTFVALKLMSRMRRWQGVPFYFRTGKRLTVKETKIAFEFRNPYATTDTPANRMEIILQGEAGMRMHLQTKMGGSDPAFRPLVLEDPLVCVGDCLDEHGLLLLEAVNGKQDWFLSFEEVMAAWKIIDPLQAYLSNPETPFALYPADSSGPKEAAVWAEMEGFEWI